MNLRFFCPDGHPVVLPVAKLGGTAICPSCYVSFLAEFPLDPSRLARPGGSKSRRDDDDDEEDEDEEDQPPKKTKPRAEKDDEKPRKKPPPVQDDDDEDDEDEEDRPRKKTKPGADRDNEKSRKKPPPVQDDDEADKKNRKKAKPRPVDDEDDEEEEEDDDDDEGTPKKKGKAKKSSPRDDGPDEEPIEWTPRKRQLVTCSNGLISLIVANYILMGFAVFCSLAIDFFEMFDEWRDPFLGPLVLKWICVPLFLLSIVAVIVSACFGFMAPAKLEGKPGLISTLVFGFLIFFVGFLVILTYCDVLTSDAVRAERFIQLLVGSALVCFVLCLVSVMAYLSRVFVFMRLNMEASQPVTNCGFFFLYLGLMLGLVYASPLLKENIGDWMCYVVALVADVLSGMAIYVLVLQVMLVNKVRATIEKYVRDA